nr:MAG TPA: hypothetical protein [Caudoviricetes sp.]
MNVFSEWCLQALYDGRGAVVSRSALSTIGLRLQAVLLVTCRGLVTSLR